MKGFGDLYKSRKKNNKTTKPSKEHIFDLAIQFHLKGNISEAAKYYRYSISQGFNDHKAFFNYGTILQSLGKFKEAEFLILKAIELKPDYSDAHNNLGNIYRELGKLQEAEKLLIKAIELNPFFAEAHLNLATIFYKLGKLQEAELSTRKAIELKPDLAEAYSNLGSILIDLGKLNELLLLSKSTLKSKTIDQEYKLIAKLRIAIANLLRKDFSATLLYLNKIKELINQGVVDKIKSEESKKYLCAYFEFISLLYPLLEKKNEQPDVDLIPHLGESHCLSFAHQTLSISSKLNQIQPVLITGGKAWHFANNQNNQWKSALTQQIKNHTYSDKVFISFGEIDCRKDEGILNYSIKYDKDIAEVCEETIKGYVNYMEEILSPNYSERYYFGVAAPTRGKKLLDDIDVKRIKMVRLYNSILKKEVLSRSSNFLDVYKLTSNKDGINNNIHMCDDYHLSPKCLSILFMNYLYKS